MLLYLGTIELGNFFYLDNYNVSVFWPASGAALALFLLCPGNCWKKLVPSLIAVNLFSNLLLHDRDAPPTLIYTLSNVAEPVIIAGLIRAWTGSIDLPWSSPKKLLLVGLAAHFGTGIGALIGAWGFLRFAPASSFWPVWQRWFAADLLGVLLVAPLVLAWSAFSLSRIREMKFMPAAEAAALFASLMFFVWEAFAYPHLPATPFHDGPHFIIVFLLWAALRFDVRVTAAAALLTVLIAVWEMKSGAWPRALESLQGGARVFYLQSLIFIYSASMLVLAAIQEGLREREQALHDAEARFHSIFDISPFAIGISDVNGIILQANPAFEKMLGYGPGKMLGMRTSEITHPDDRADMPRYYNELHAHQDKATRVSKRYLRTDGTAIDAELRLLVLRQGERKPPLRLAIIEDVTEKKRATVALKESEEFLRETGRMAKVGGWWLDAATLAVGWTEETFRIHELPVGQMPPLEDAINYYVPEDRPKLSRLVQRALEHGEPYDAEFRLITAKGHLIWTRSICRPHVVDGKTIKLTGTFQDITFIREAEQSLLRRENLAVAGRIAAGVAHEINNPINIILGLAEVVMLERKIAKQTRRDLEAIVVHAKRAGAITRGLLHIGRKIQPSPQAFPVQELIDTTRQLLRQELKRDGVSLAADPEAEPVEAYADPDQIQQVLLNLILNAIDAMKDSSFKRITVHLEETPDTVKVEIGDTGPGVSVKNAHNIFEPFFTTKTPSASTGMGLAISRGIAEKNDGSLALANPGEEGARFVLTLPKPRRV